MALKNKFSGVYHPSHKLALLSLDMTAFAASFLLASQYRLNSNPDFFSLEYVGIITIVLSCLFIGGAYTSQRINPRPKLPLNTFFVVLASCIVYFSKQNRNQKVVIVSAMVT